MAEVWLRKLGIGYDVVFKCPPWDWIRAPVGSGVRQFTTEAELTFVRVGTPPNPTGQFLARADEIAGMTPQQIQQHLALPQVPTHISEVTVPAGTSMQMGPSSEERRAEAFSISFGTSFPIIVLVCRGRSNEPN